MKVPRIYTRGRIWRRLLNALTLILLASTPALVRGSLNQTDKDLVNQFFPDFLIEESEEDFAKGGPAPFRTSAFAVADLGGTGTDLIVAAYTNGFSAAIRVLRREGTAAVLVDEPALPLLGGIFPSVTFRDLNNDGRLEVMTSFSSARGTGADWVFRWNGSALVFLGPSSVDPNGDESTLLGGADFIDLDADGILEIVNPPQLGPVAADEDAPDVELFDIFGFDGNRYTFSRSVNYFSTFVRNEGKPVVIERTFDVASTEVPYLLEIINGTGGPGTRVSSAVIRLNGEVVIDPRRFNQRVAEITEKVNLLSSNSLTVELRSAPGSQLSVIVAQEQ